MEGSVGKLFTRDDDCRLTLVDRVYLPADIRRNGTSVNISQSI